MNFEDHFSFILSQNKKAFDNRILKLEQQFPQEFEKKQNEFLEKFFSEDPFEIRPQDLETFIAPTGKIKKLKEDRRPSTFLSIFRFLELFRQLFQSIQKDITLLGQCHKMITDGKIRVSDSIKEKIANQILSGSKLLSKWQPQTDALFKLLIQNINQSIVESEANHGKGKGFINLRKVQSEHYLNTTFHPYYDALMNFSIMCIAFSGNMKNETKQLLEDAGVSSLA